MSDRLTRKDIKRNELVEGLDRVIEFLQNNARNLILGASGLLLIVVAVLAFGAVRKGRVEKANVLLSEALKVAAAPVGDEAVAGSGLSFATAEERDAKARELFTDIEKMGIAPAQVASAFLGDLAASSGDLDSARGHWEGVAQSEGSSLLGAAMQANLLAVDRAQGRGEEALARLQGWLESGKSVLPQDALLRELGATYEALGRSEEAQQTYQRLVDEHPSSAFVSEVRSKIAS